MKIAIKLILISLIVCMSAMSCAWAGDANLTADAVSGENEGTFDDLYLLIENTSEGGTLQLDRNYCYAGGSAGAITIGKTIFIDGNGHSIDGGGLSAAFNITGAVSLRNIEFANCRASSLYSNGGAICWSGDYGIVSNCSFINCSSNGNGGAIGWFGQHGSLSDCTFVGCSASSSYSSPELPSRLRGGAVYWNADNGSLSDCIFFDCISNFTGGAVHWIGNGGSISNSSFSRASANVGKAIYWTGRNGSITCSTFTDFSGNGETISWNSEAGTIIGCGFFNCSGGRAIRWYGKDGSLHNSSFVGCLSHGAVEWYGDYGSICNSSFINCLNNYTSISFRDGGGAVSWKGANGMISHSDFINCSASQSYSYGGAVRGGTVHDCAFVNCSAYCGGAVCESMVSNCSFDNCHASFGGAVLWEIKNGSLADSTFINCSASYSGGAVLFNGDNGVAYNCSFIGCSCYENASRSGRAMYSGYAQGCVFKDCGYVDEALCDTVFKCCAFEKTGCYIISVPSHNISCGDVIITELPDGTVVLTVDDKDYAFDVAEGKAEIIIPDLANGDYDYMISYSGNGDCSSFAVNGTIKVNNADDSQANSTKTLPEMNVVQSSDAFLEVALPDDATGTVTLVIGNESYQFPVSYGLANIILPDLADGDYNYTVIYCGDDRYLPVACNASMKVNRVLSTYIEASAFTTVYNSGKSLVVTLKDQNGKPIGGAELHIVLAGRTYNLATSSNGQVRVSASALVPVKKYTATVTFAGNSKYAKSSKKVAVTIRKATPKLTAKSKAFKAKAVKKYSVALKTNRNKALKNARVTIKFAKFSRTVRTDAKGIARFSLAKLTKKGNFVAVVKFAVNNYYKAKSVKVRIAVR